MKYLFALLLFFPLCIHAQHPTAGFQVIPLGVYGGAIESNLSGYMIAPVKSDAFVCLDAGTVRSGIQKAVDNHVFKNITAEKVLRSYIKGYLISHAHLDHLAGMILNSPADTAKTIYALPEVVSILTDKYFSWKSWANFTNEGEIPRLNKYILHPLDTIKELPLANTSMFVSAFRLSHVNPYASTAFLLRNQDDYVLYLGDTGSDTIEQSHCLNNLWQHIAPLINNGRLKAIFIETSFPDEQPDKLLFGHLTPRLLQRELQVLNGYCTPGMLPKTPLIITHIKPDGNNEKKIKQQLIKNNPLKMHYIFPEQGRVVFL